jgi:hypothetical protein
MEGKPSTDPNGTDNSMPNDGSNLQSYMLNTSASGGAVQPGTQVMVCMANAANLALKWAQGARQSCTPGNGSDATNPLTDTTPCIMVAPQQTTEVSVHGLNAQGQLVGKGAVTICVATPAQVTIAGPDGNVPPGTPVMLTANVVAVGTSYDWYEGAAEGCGTADASVAQTDMMLYTQKISPTVTQSTTFVVKVKDPSGTLVGMGARTVCVQAPPNCSGAVGAASFVFKDTSGQAIACDGGNPPVCTATGQTPISVTLDASGSDGVMQGQIRSFKWNLPLAFDPTCPQSSCAYSTTAPTLQRSGVMSGTYPVQLQTEDDCNRISTMVQKNLHIP